MELPLAALHQLSAPLLDGVAGLPGPQRAALESACGIREGQAPSPLPVGLAKLTLLSDASADQPVVCVVDDAQWLDRSSAQALAFVARRLGDERVAVLFAVRELSSVPELARLPTFAAKPLSDQEARALLAIALELEGVHAAIGISSEARRDADLRFVGLYRHLF